MIFSAIACFRRLESRFSGQNGPRSSEMRVYIEITGHIKNHQNFKILFWSRESEKPIFTIFPEFLREKIRNTGITSETTIPEISSETTETRNPLSRAPEFLLRMQAPVGRPASHEGERCAAGPLRCVKERAGPLLCVTWRLLGSQN